MGHSSVQGEYDPKLFNELQVFEVAQKKLRRKNLPTSLFTRLRTLFRYYDVHVRYGLILLHRHFTMDADEKLVEFRGVATPWKKVPSSYKIFGGEVVPRCWGFFEDGRLHPTEFGFDTKGGMREQFDPSFISQLYEILKENGVEKYFGLTVFDSDMTDGPRMLERTLGRVSITLPLSQSDVRNDESQMEAAWTFGCHESMDDSNMIAGRICWVCDGCK